MLFRSPYDHKIFQHDFSFFKGTLFHEIMKRIKSEKGMERVEQLYDTDKSLYNTTFGEKIKNILNISDGDFSISKIKNLRDDSVLVSEVLAPNSFARLTGRAMKRVTVLGVATIALLELPKILKSFKNGNSTGEKIESVAKQTVKSGINTTSVVSGMAYGGAYGAQKGGATGSLIGMGFGAVLGTFCSDKIQKTIF